MNQKQLKKLTNLLKQYKHDYQLDSMTEFVYIHYLLEDIKIKVEEEKLDE